MSRKQISSILFRIVVLLLLTFRTDSSNAKDYRHIDSVMRVCPSRHAQTVENLGKYIKSRFDSDSDRLRAAYSWVAHHISYDVAKMYSGIRYKHESEVVVQVLKTRKTVCFGYAVTLNSILENLGIKAVTVRGYTKQNGSIDKIPHSWCAVKHNDEWLLIDPTWSAGYLLSGVFHKKFNDKWYLIKPEDIISSHIPFDPVWQFSYFPVNSMEFSTGIRSDSVTSRFFSYPDTLNIIEKLPEKEYRIAENRRIRSMGVDNSMIAEYIENNSAHIEHIEHDENVTAYNKAVELFNSSGTLYVNGSANSLETAIQKLDEASNIIDSIRTDDREMSASIRKLKKMINNLQSQIKKTL
jgi:hypothetical protein